MEININGFIVLIDEYDYNKLKNYKWKILKRNSTYHVYRRLNNRNIYMHHDILPIKTNQCIDHINGNGLDNRRCNIRIANKSTNGMNRCKSSNNKSGYKGVTFKNDGFRKKPYRATIVLNRKQFSLGVYKTAKEAAEAYNKAAIKYHGKFARLNKIEESE